MEITVGLFLVLFVIAFVCEFIDSSLGMGYGTILSPLLIIMGFDPLVAVPAILLSQAFGGFTAAVFHHQFENASFSPRSRDFKIVFVISSFGLVATVAAALMALHISQFGLLIAERLDHWVLSGVGMIVVRELTARLPGGDVSVWLLCGLALYGFYRVAERQFMRVESSPGDDMRIALIERPLGAAGAEGAYAR